MRGFFFSSRRRHTIFDCDWSSDVCSSDLRRTRPGQDGHGATTRIRGRVDQTRQAGREWRRSEEHTSELQSQSNLVCRLLLEKKKKIKNQYWSVSDDLVTRMSRDDLMTMW